MGLLCVSVDLDEVRCYHEIHGLEVPAQQAAHIIYNRALPRVARFFEELNIPVTFFVVGQDLRDCAGAVRLLGHLAARGHEIGNHTMHHRYDLTTLQSAVQAEEIDQCTEVISRLLGITPRGFRAPGYNMHLGLIHCLANRGFLYDSSVFPCPAYYAARVAAIGAKSLRGRASTSLMGDPRVLTSPTTPYRIGEDGLWIRGQGLPELPISVVTGARLPFIGTALTMMGAFPARVLAKRAARLPFVNLELHGIDFVDADGDGLGPLKAHQPDLRIPLVKRRNTLVGVIKTLLDAGLEPLTLAQAASRIFI